MTDPQPVSHRLVEFETPDGVALIGDLALPSDPRAAAIICHPHPMYGGNRHDHVVSGLFDALPPAGVAALRFDFRATFDGGAGELLDAAAALDTLAEEVPGVPLAVTGYSFGAMIALGLSDSRIIARVLIAPPLAPTDPPPAAPSPAPILVITPRHDQFSPPDATAAVVAAWERESAAPIDHRIIEMADHFLHGFGADVGVRAAGWLAGRP